MVHVVFFVVCLFFLSNKSLFHNVFSCVLYRKMIAYQEKIQVILRFPGSLSVALKGGCLGVRIASSAQCK